MRMTLTADQISNALDYVHEAEDIEEDANRAFDEDEAEEKRILAEMREKERIDNLDFEAQVLDCGYSIGELRRAFRLVCNQGGWKLPIDAKVTANLQTVLEFAIPFMVGSTPTFEAIGSTGYVRVRASGYYADIGA